MINNFFYFDLINISKISFKMINYLFKKYYIELINKYYMSKISFYLKMNASKLYFKLYFTFILNYILNYILNCILNYYFKLRFHNKRFDVQHYRSAVWEQVHLHSTTPHACVRLATPTSVRKRTSHAEFLKQLTFQDLYVFSPIRFCSP